MRILDTVCGPAYSLPRLSGLLSHPEGGLVRRIEFRDRVGTDREPPMTHPNHAALAAAAPRELRGAEMWDGIRTEIDPTVAAVSTLLIGVTAAVIGAITLVRRRAGEDGP